MYAIPNLSAKSTFACEPWEFKPEVPADAKLNKSDFISWCQQPSTKHCHFSAAEGMDPMRRVNVENPVVQLHGFVADYDSVIPADSIKALSTKSPIEYIPNWGCNTFSGGARLVWMFEKPILVRGFDLAKAFQTHAMKKLKLSKFLAGLDSDAFIDTAKYYERGREWYPLSSDKIPMSMLYNWLFEAGNKVKWATDGSVRIPFDRIYTEVQAKFPGRWSGPFTDGTRGVRFWDSEADNSTGAVVRESGMQCFTGARPFVTWKEIFGPKFVEEYEADTIGAIIEGYFFDGSSYWNKNQRNQWEMLNREDMRLTLKVKYNLSTVASKGTSFSEVDRVAHAVQTQKRVVAALPFVHHPEGVMRAPDGQYYLNTARAVAMRPADETGGGWGERFPWIAQFLDSFFTDQEQLPYFLAWWKHFYSNALAQTPKSGQAVFFIGPTGIGKTLLSSGLIGPTVGGCAEASNYLLGVERFTSHILNSPVMAVDDTCPAATTQNHTKYSSMIKKLVANRTAVFEEKFQKAGHVTWLGRIVVTGNDDPESIRLLPNIDMSITDKVSFFHCVRTEARQFPSDLKEILANELPHLCRWLLEWTIPEGIVGSARFGVKPYHDPWLMSSAVRTSGCFMFLETLLMFLEEYGESQKKETYKGTSSGLFVDMSQSVTIAPLITKYNTISIGMWLGQLQSKGVDIRSKTYNSGKVWTIPTKLKVNNAFADTEGDADDSAAK